MTEPHIRRPSLLTYARFAVSKVIYFGDSEADHSAMPALVLVADLPKLLVFAIQDIKTQDEAAQNLEISTTPIALETVRKKVHSSIGAGVLRAYDPHVFLPIDLTRIATDRDVYLVRLDDVSAWLKTQGIEVGYSVNSRKNNVWDEGESQNVNISAPEKVAEFNIDPADLPDELHAANIAFRAVTNGHGDPSATFKNRLVGYLENSFPGLKNEAVQRIATVANPDKGRGRKKANIE